MQKVYDQTVSPASIAKMILNELWGFNPLILLKCPFVLLGHGGFVLPSSHDYSLCGALQGTTPRLSMKIHPEHLIRKRAL